MEKKDIDKILNEFKTIEDTGIDISKTTEKVIEKEKISLEKIVQMGLAYFTAGLLASFLLIPCIFLAFGRISYDQTIDFLKTVMALLGSITGAVWGYYFQSIKN